MRATAATAEVWAILATVYNRRGKRYKASDLFPAVLDDKPQPRPKRQKTLEEMLVIIEGLKQVIGSKGDTAHD